VLPWPFVGREEILRRIVASLLDPAAGGAVLAGPAGVGKSRLAEQALRQLESPRWRLAQVRATRSAAGIPFGALGHLLPASGPPIGANVTGWAAEHLTAAAGGRRLVIGVDDAHLLDEYSAAVVHLLAHTRAARLLVTVRTGEVAPDPVVALWKDGLATRVELTPFDLDEVREILATGLAGPVAEQTVHRFWRASAGNALLLRELAGAAVDSGVLAAPAGVWTMAGGPPLSTALTDLIDTRIGRLDETERDVLEYVALAEPIGLGLVEKLTSRTAVEALEERDLVRVSTDGQRCQLRLAHPLFGELARARCPTLRTQRHLSELADATVAAGARRREDVLRVAVWRLDSGSPTGPEALLAGCRAAWAVHDSPLARKLGRAAVAAGGGIPAALTLADILNTGDHFDEAESVLATIWDEPCDESTRTQVVLARAHTLGWGLGRQDEALALLADSEARVDSAADRQALALQRMTIVGTAQGRWSEAAALGEALLAEPATPALAAGIRFEQGWLMLYLGRPLNAIALAEQVLDDREAWYDDTPQWTGDMHTLIIQASQTVGDLTTFETAIERASAEVGHSEIFANTVLVNRGIAALLRGRSATAVRLLREAETCRPVASRAMSGQAELARALAYQGDADAAEAALGEGGRRLFVFREQKTPFGVRLNAPWVAVARGELSTALELCLDAAGFFQTQGAVRRELIARHDAVRLGGAARVVGRLAEIAAGYQGELATACAAHARAAAEGDGAGLDGVAARFARMGRLLHAAEAYAQAADAHTGARSRTAGAKARVLAEACEGTSTPALARLHAVTLTAREREIAHLAAGGMTSARIAATLHLSVRTVDNHLGSAYTKLGVTGRAELAEVLRGGSVSSRR